MSISWDASTYCNRLKWQFQLLTTTFINIIFTTLFLNERRLCAVAAVWSRAATFHSFSEQNCVFIGIPQPCIRDYIKAGAGRNPCRHVLSEGGGRPPDKDTKGRGCSCLASESRSRGVPVPLCGQEKSSSSFIKKKFKKWMLQNALVKRLNYLTSDKTQRLQAQIKLWNPQLHKHKRVINFTNTQWTDDKYNPTEESKSEVPLFHSLAAATPVSSIPVVLSEKQIPHGDSSGQLA